MTTVEEARDDPRGYVGRVFEEVFEDLYAGRAPDAKPSKDQPADDEPAEGDEPAQDEPGQEGVEPATFAPVQDILDFSEEESAINAIGSHLKQESERVREMKETLHMQQAFAQEQDRHIAMFLKAQGLTLHHQYPVGPSTLHVRDPRDTVVSSTAHGTEQRLVDPRTILAETELEVRISQGIVDMHVNLLSTSKPAEPNHYKMTASLEKRKEVRQIEPRLTEDDRAALEAKLKEQAQLRPPMPSMLSADEREENRLILRRMQTKVSFLCNPRYVIPEGEGENECPFRITPKQAIFRGYKVGGVYEIEVAFMNTTKIGRRLRILPQALSEFSVTPLTYDAAPSQGYNPDGVIFPGLSARCKILFHPVNLNDLDTDITLSTELGKFKFPILARRYQPQLVYEQSVEVGKVLAGRSQTATFRIRNMGGEGAARFTLKGLQHQAAEAQGKTRMRTSYLSAGGHQGMFDAQDFKLYPAAFYLEHGQYIDIEIDFCSHEVGRHRRDIVIEIDNGTTVPLTLSAITDAARMELTNFNGRPVKALKFENFQDQLINLPCEVNWTHPPLEVGGVNSKRLTLSNGSFLPMKIRWTLVEPPRNLKQQVETGMRFAHLRQEIYSGIENCKNLHTYPSFPADVFTVTPAEVTISAFESQEFTITFSPLLPKKKWIALACCYVDDIHEAAVLSLDRMQELQTAMQPESYAAKRGSVLAANGWLQLDPKSKPELVGYQHFEHDNASSTCIHHLVLTGESAEPTVTFKPPAVIWPRPVLPFMAHKKHFTLTNHSAVQASYSFLLSDPRATNLVLSDRVLLASEDWAGKAAKEPNGPPPKPGDDDWMDRLVNTWPPLPPESAGANAVAVVRPGSGSIAPGQTQEVELWVRTPSEEDLNFKVTCNIDDCEEPLIIPVQLTTRGPVIETEHTALLDCGLVRAHAMHTLRVTLSNPTPLPVAVQPFHVQHRICTEHKVVPRAPAQVTLWPFKGHDDVARSCLERPADAGVQEAGGSWSWEGAQATGRTDFDYGGRVCAICGCVDYSARLLYTKTKPVIRKAIDRGLDMTDEDQGDGSEEELEDPAELDQDLNMFRFDPPYVLVPPFSSSPLEVTFLAYHIEKFKGEIELRVFGAERSPVKHLKVMAEVQLPRVRLSDSALKWNVTFLKTKSEARTIFLINSSDMPAPFEWITGVHREGQRSSGLEVSISPREGVVNPRAKLQITVNVLPSHFHGSLGSSAEVWCNCFIKDNLAPLQLRVNATVYGLQVDYNVFDEGVTVPDITPVPRELLENLDESFPVAGGSAEGRRQGKKDGPRAPAVDFGRMPLLHSKKKQVVLYNRSGIAAPFVVKMERFPAFDPNKRAKRMGKVLSAVSRMQSIPGGGSIGGGAPSSSRTASTQQHQTKPQAASLRRVTGLGQRHFLLDDVHEKQSFRSTKGQEFARQKELREMGAAALNFGHGYAVRLTPSNDWLPPFGKKVIECCCFSDLPGHMWDELVIQIRGMPDFRLPVEVLSEGNPVSLPDQQVSLNKNYDPARLNVGSIMAGQSESARTFKVANHSAAHISLDWKMYSLHQIERFDAKRDFIKIALCKEPSARSAVQFAMWGQDVQEVMEGEECPMTIEPRVATVPKHGNHSFQASLSGRLAGLHKYRFVAKGRYAAGEGDGKSAEQKNLERTGRREIPKTGAAEVQQLPLADVDSDSSDAEQQVQDDGAEVEDVQEIAKAKERREKEEKEKVDRSKTDDLPPPPDLDIVSIVVLDGHGAILQPRLVVDKSVHHGGVQSLKFAYSISPPQSYLETVGQPPKGVLVHEFPEGNVVSGGGNLSPRAGVTFAICRTLALVNEAQTKCAVRFETVGPFAIRRIEVVGYRPIRPPFSEEASTSVPNPKGLKGNAFMRTLNEQQSLQVARGPTQELSVPPKACVIVHLQFIAPPPKEWGDKAITQISGKFLLHYPGGNEDQFIELQANCYKPSFGIRLVPKLLKSTVPDDALPWGPPRPPVVEFDYSHVQASTFATRQILLFNESYIPGKWKLFHVARTQKRPPELGLTLAEVEEHGAADQPTVFSFDVVEGLLAGPTKDSAYPYPDRAPRPELRVMPLSRTLPSAWPHDDEWRYLPTKVTITFVPERDLLYKSRFRIQVEGGESVDFLCRGCGSYDEEDDVVEVEEA